MNSESLYPVFPALFIAIMSVLFVSKVAGLLPVNSGKYASVDGLRGYLAFFVFLHHSLVWFFFLKSDKWTDPASNVYTNFGETSVSLFFMITGFLFFSKLIEGKKRPIDWLRLFVSRILRLTPLYLFAVTILFLLVAILSDFTFQESKWQVLNEAFDWITFTVKKAPLINGYKQTILITANVTWTLVMEWLFYLSLPFMGIFIFKLKVPLLSLTICGILIVWIMLNGRSGIFPAVSFSGGIAAAFLVRSPKFCVLATKKISSVILIILLLSVISLFHTSYTISAQALISIPFILIACGNTLFGILTSKASKLLGQLSYSIYLLHAILLFVVFKFIIGFDVASKFSPFQHWLVILISVIPLIIVCNITYYFIELPVMNASNKVTAFVRRRFQKASELRTHYLKKDKIIEVSATNVVVKEKEDDVLKQD